MTDAGSFPTPGTFRASETPNAIGARRLRVLYLIGFLAADGGAERFALGLATHLPRDRFEPWVCVPRGAEPAAAAVLREAAIPLLDLGRRAKWDVHRLGALPRLLHNQSFDVLHAHMFGSNLWGMLAGRVCGVPVRIAHEHTWSYEGDPVRAFLDGRVIGPLASRFIAVSGADAERMVRIEHVAPEKVTVMPTAYVPRPPTGGADLRAELGLAADTPLYGTAAVMRPQKALHVLVEAHARVVAALPTAHLVIAGDGECRGAVARRSEELGVADSVHLLGRRPDIDAIVAAFDVAAMCSDFEGTPLFALECLANHTALVATAVGGLPDLLDDGTTGLLVAPRDPAALAEAILALLLDPDRRAAMARAAAPRLDDYRLETIAARFGDLYEQLYAEATMTPARGAGAKGARWTR
jgi:glycosyltransferase involved in cell wall biosynthesis